MRSSTLGASALLAASALAAPVETRDSNIDVIVLQFALTAENLEDVFYKQALTNFTEQDFMDAGFSSTYYHDLRYVASDEQEHTEFLKASLSSAGVMPNEACTYDFGVDNVRDFVKLASVIEGIGTSAYLGAAPLITNKGYLSAAVAIDATEGKHTGFQRLAISEVPFLPPFCTPLDPTSVFTLLARFIVSCPSSNMPLGFTPFNTLMYKPDMSSAAKSGESSYGHGHEGGGWWNHGRWGWGNGGGNRWWHPQPMEAPAPKAGDSVEVMIEKGSVPADSYMTFVNGLSVVSVPAHVDGMTISGTIPVDGMDGGNMGGIVYGIEGQVYTYITKSNVTNNFNNSQVLYGPAIIEVAPGPPRLNFTES